MNLTLKLLKAGRHCHRPCGHLFGIRHLSSALERRPGNQSVGAITVHSAVKHDLSQPLGSLAESGKEMDRDAAHSPALEILHKLSPLTPTTRMMKPSNRIHAAPITPPVITTPPGAERLSKNLRALVRAQSLPKVSMASASDLTARRAPPLCTTHPTIASPSGRITFSRSSIRASRSTRRKASNSTRRAKVLYGSVPTNTIFKGFGGTCEMTNNGDAVVRYDQLADRWLVVMPIFGAALSDQINPNRERLVSLLR